MKLIDFSYPGGFPITPEVFAFMQSAYVGTTGAAYMDAGQSPVIISGMVVNVPGQQLTPGWCMIAGELLYFAGGAIDPQVETYIAVQNTKGSATFENLILREIYVTKTAVIVASGTAGSVGLSTFQHWSVPMIANVRTRIKTLTVAINAPAGTTGSCTFKKDPWTGLVNLRGTFTVSNPSLLQGGAMPFYGFGGGSQPEDYWPKDDVPFAALVRHHSYVPPLEDTGKDYIRQINCTLQGGTGSMNAGLLKAANAYTASFNVTYPTW